MKKPSTKPKHYLSRFSENARPGDFSSDACLPAGQAALHPGFLDRISIFETVRSYEASIFHFDEHWQRLAESAQGIGRVLPFSKEECRRWALRLIGESGFPDSVLRLSVHWENETSLPPPAGRAGAGQAGGAVVFIVRKFKSYPEEIYRKGVTLKSAVPRRWNLKAQDSRIKASQYTSGVLAVLDDPRTKAWELVFLSQDGYVAEGSVSNIFIIKGKRVLTPCVGSGILKGVTREAVIGLARKRGFEVVETFLTRHEIYTAGECFLTNTSSEVLPVVGVDGRQIGSGRPGPVTKILRREFEKLRQRWV